MNLVLSSLVRAIGSQLHGRMLLLTFLPFALAIVLWGVLLWLGLQPLIDMLHGWFADYSLFRSTGELLDKFGLTHLKTILVPLLAMWLLLPLMILTALALVGLIAMPAIARHVGARFYPQLLQRHGGSLWGSVWVSLSSFAVFLVVWLLSLPLNLIPLFALFVQPLLWGWLTYRVMSYDVLADYADADERRAIVHSHRWPLMTIGVVTGALGMAPGLLWLGGVVAVIFFPVLAAAAIWLYLLVFVFSGLWFEHYCLAALVRLRQQGTAMPSAADMIDLH